MTRSYRSITKEEEEEEEERVGWFVIQPVIK